MSEVNLSQSEVFIKSKPKRGVTAYIIILRKGAIFKTGNGESENRGMGMGMGNGERGTGNL